ncbi:MAG: phosphate ABC transporter permease PstA [Candidatus Freyarchaeota archaeon]|nr:phosphate ABC transporter permease PstA [Candidatus Jordarchaeia archaeon]MBS7269713.1 phosphate ABC transporter permease PstA [Candidatus Jordarchaeia archaeon]MBS7280235.1 phosphate ABC transporter permease PstA [Candidatus Jordarchaeia archaeon]
MKAEKELTAVTKGVGLGEILFSIPTLLILASFILIMGVIIINGAQVINWEFITGTPGARMLYGTPLGLPLSYGGILPMIFGTLALVSGAICIAVPLGILSAIYINEYLHEGRLKSFIIQTISNLAGVPSIVFGLFAFAFFCKQLNFGVSLLSGWLVLGFMALPIIVKSTEEALKTIPKSFREASLALGATKWETITKTVLPVAAPGISTGTILGIGRVAGETAAILFAAAVFYQSSLYPTNIFQPVMALTYHLYYEATTSPFAAVNRPYEFGTALVLVGLVLLFVIFAMYIRNKGLKRRKGW